MATKAKAPKATTAPAATTPAANPFTALVAPATAPAATALAPKVHSLQVGATTYKAANHVATFKGTKAVTLGGVSYTLTGNVYNPAAGHINAAQWAAVTQAIKDNGGQATVGQIAAAFTAAGLAAGLANGFVAYRAKGNKPNLKQVA